MKEIMSGEQASGGPWIRVEDGLPERIGPLTADSELVLIRMEGDWMVTGRYHTENAAWVGHSDERIEGVTHWAEIRRPK